MGMIPEKGEINKVSSPFAALTEYRRSAISLRVGDRVEGLERPRWIAVSSLFVSRTLLTCVLHLNELATDGSHEGQQCTEPEPTSQPGNLTIHTALSRLHRNVSLL